MKFVSFNINGLRAHMHQLDAIITSLNPDIIGLQEIKVHDNEFPKKEILKHGYYVYYYGQKKYHGVALLFKKPPLSIKHGFTDDDPSEKRTIIAKIFTSIGILTIINSYFPQGENIYSKKFVIKQQFYQKMQNYIQKNYNNQSLLLIMGDMNISPTDLDIGIGEKNKQRWLNLGQCAFLPEERQWINKLMNWGLIDIYRSFYPYKNDCYSWFSYISNGFYKNRGLRIDLILVTKPLVTYHKHSAISYDIRSMKRPSDHAPVWTDFDI